MASPIGKRIAIIGSGISGLLSAYLLARRNQVVVYEAADVIGGHTATKAVHIGDTKFEVDTGFIVFNDRTYPNFIKLLEMIGVAYQPTDMGFSVSCAASGFEYAGTSLNGVFSQRKNIFNPGHWRMLAEILRFNKACTQLYRSGEKPWAITCANRGTAKGSAVYTYCLWCQPFGHQVWKQLPPCPWFFLFAFFTIMVC